MTKPERVSMDIESAYKNNNDYSLQLARWFLIIIGAWPRENVSMIKRISLHVHISVCLFMMVIVIVPCFLYLMLEVKDLPNRINTVGPLSHWVMGGINYWFLLMGNDDIRQCVQHMEMDWKLSRKVENREIMLRHAKIGRFVAVFSAIFMQFGSLLFIIAKGIDTVTVVVGNETISMHPTSCPVYCKIIDERFSPVNEIVLIVQILSCFLVNCVTVGACSLAACFAMHAHGQLNILFLWLNELVTDDDKGNKFADQRLAAIVEQHLRVLSFISRIENVMQHICLVELVECTMNMCLLAYYTIMKWDDFDTAQIASYVIIYISMAINIFIFCCIGEILTEQCKKVGEKVYMTNWYKLPRKTALGLILIIARSNNVTKITAGKLLQLSISTFGDVIKTSFVYLNILRTRTST